MGGTWFGMSVGPYVMLAVGCVLLGYVAGARVAPVRHAATVAVAVAMTGSAVVVAAVATSSAAGVASLVAAGAAGAMVTAAAVYGLLTAHRLAAPRKVAPTSGAVRARATRHEPARVATPAHGSTTKRPHNRTSASAPRSDDAATTRQPAAAASKRHTEGRASTTKPATPHDHTPAAATRDDEGGPQ